MIRIIRFAIALAASVSLAGLSTPDAQAQSWDSTQFENAMAAEIQQLAAYSGALHGTYTPALDVLGGDAFYAVYDALADGGAADVDAFAGKISKARSAIATARQTLGPVPELTTLKRQEPERMGEIIASMHFQTESILALSDSLTGLIGELEATVGTLSDMPDVDERNGVLRAFDLYQLRANRDISEFELLSNRRALEIQDPKGPRYYELDLIVQMAEVSLGWSALEESDLSAPADESWDAAKARRIAFLPAIERHLARWPESIAKGRDSLPYMKTVLTGAKEASQSERFQGIMDTGNALEASFLRTFDAMTRMAEAHEARVALFRTATSRDEFESRLDPIYGALDTANMAVFEENEKRQALLGG